MKLRKLAKYIFLFLLFLLTYSRLYAHNTFSRLDFLSSFPRITVPAEIRISTLNRFLFHPTVTSRISPTPTFATNPTPTVIPLLHLKKQFVVSGGINPGPNFPEVFWILMDPS